MATTKTKAAAPPKKAAPAIAKDTPLKTGPPTPAQLQLQAFEKAVRLFSEQRFTDAAQVFREVAKGPALNVADRARGYMRVCDRKTTVVKIEFRTADDHFHYAVERLNARDFEKAKLHLTNALKMNPKGDHILYTMAIYCGLAGDGNGAYENLKRAIEVEPRNRLHARQDSDFSVVVERFPELRTLLEA